MVLKDIWGANDREVEALARWMLDAIITAALRDAATAPEVEGAPARAGGQKQRAAHARPCRQYGHAEARLMQL